MFVTLIPGTAQAVSRELDHREGVKVTGFGFDGRSDLVLFDVERGYRQGLRSLRIVEGLFVEVGRTTRSSGDKAEWIAGRIWRPERVEKALFDETHPGRAIFHGHVRSWSQLRPEMQAALRRAGLVDSRGAILP